MTNFLHSGYIIDGIQMALTPAQMLQECCLSAPPLPPAPVGVTADERLDVAPSPYQFDETQVAAYARAVDGVRHSLPLAFSGPYTVSRIAQALLDTLWMGGHFRLGDLTLRADWRWNDRSIGHRAAFYDSVAAASEYIDAMGVKIARYSVSPGTPSVSFKATTVPEEEAPDEEESLFRELPYRTANPRISRRRRCPLSLVDNASDWIIYIPFDPCEYRLGGSLLAEATGVRPSTAAEVGDADYFIDCFEVVRELVEDGIVKAATTVGDGGLYAALQGMTGTTGARICIQDISKAMNEPHAVRILFGEVPGALLQIADIDYDYVDAELLLQDVVYYPIGHPVPGQPGIQMEEKIDLPGILESLMNTREGED